jgi:DNA-binding MarR family transcriptional regulator
VITTTVVREIVAVTHSLETEIQQSQPFESPADRALLNVLRTSSLLEQASKRFFKQWGLTQTQYNALRILRGTHPSTLLCRELGERLVSPVPDVTRLIDRLTRKNLAYRTLDPADRRVIRLGITNEGLETLADIDEPLREWTERRLGHMSPRDLEELSRLLERARNTGS